MTTPRLALGTAQLGMDYGVANRAGQPSADERDRILQTACDLEIDWIDTAPSYGDAEQIVGRFLRRTSRSWRPRVCTKTPRFPSGLQASALANATSDAIERSRERLDVETIDVLLVHGADLLREYGHALVDVLTQHRDAGRIRRIGLSLYDEVDIALALSHPALAATQLPFSILHADFVKSRAIERLRLAGHQVMIRSVLHQGLLVLTPDAAESKVPGSGVWLRTFHRMCGVHDVDPVRAAIRYAALRSGADVMVIGVESADQLQDAAAHLRQGLPPSFIADVEQAFVDVPSAVRDPRQWRGAA